MFFVSSRSDQDSSTAEAWKLQLETGQLSPVTFNKPLAALNGAVKYGGDGDIAVSVKGSAATGVPAGVALVNAYTGNTSWLFNSFFGLRFYGGNDVVALADGSIL